MEELPSTINQHKMVQKDDRKQHLLKDSIWIWAASEFNRWVSVNMCRKTEGTRWQKAKSNVECLIKHSTNILRQTTVADNHLSCISMPCPVSSVQAFVDRSKSVLVRLEETSRWQTDSTTRVNHLSISHNERRSLNKLPLLTVTGYSM